MYSLNSPIYTATFPSIYELLSAVIDFGVCPDQEIMFNGKPTGQMASDLIVH